MDAIDYYTNKIEQLKQEVSSISLSLCSSCKYNSYFLYGVSAGIHDQKEFG